MKKSFRLSPNEQSDEAPERNEGVMGRLSKSKGVKKRLHLIQHYVPPSPQGEGLIKLGRRREINKIQD
jgi:hypothetical protein